MTESANNNRSVLIIESEPESAVADFLGPRYVCERARNEDSVLRLLGEERFGVIVSPYVFGDLNGLGLLELASSTSPRAAVILIGSEEHSEEAIECFRAGAFDFIRKPFELDYLATAVERAFAKHEAALFTEQYRASLENLVADRNAALDRALEDVENSYRVTLKALVQALETRDFETHGHSERVVTFSLRLGHEMGLDRDALRDLELGALLHDIGKIGVPDAILRKPSKLSEKEWEKMKQHPVHGHRILRNIPFLSGAAKVVSQHHERWDGSGYPKGLKGEAIDIGARIFAVIDAFDAMISDRVYRKGRTYEDAVAELRNCEGTQFDPEIVEAFAGVPQEDWELLRERSIRDRQEVFSFQDIVEELVRSKKAAELVH